MAPNSVNVPLAVATGVLTTAWYALPDVVRSRPLRAVLKTCLAGGGGAAWWVLRQTSAPEPGPDVYDEVIHAVNRAPGRALAIGAVALGGGTALSVAGEKALFALGERRRARGVRWAHTLPALGWGVVAGVATLPD